MNTHVALMPVNTQQIAEMIDATEVAGIWRQAEALRSLYKREPDHEMRELITTKRNTAMRRLGQMYLSLESKQLGFDTKSKGMTRTQFGSNLNLTSTDVSKITSIANLSNEEFEDRKHSDGDYLWMGTSHGDKLKADRQRVKDALKLMQQKRAEEKAAADSAFMGDLDPTPTETPQTPYVAPHIEPLQPSQPERVAAIQDKYGIHDVQDVKRMIMAMEIIIKMHNLDKIKGAHELHNKLFDVTDRLIGVCESIQAAARG